MGASGTSRQEGGFQGGGGSRDPRGRRPVWSGFRRLADETGWPARGGASSPDLPSLRGSPGRRLCGDSPDVRVPWRGGACPGMGSCPHVVSCPRSPAGAAARPRRISSDPGALRRASTSCRRSSSRRAGSCGGLSGTRAASARPRRAFFSRSSIDPCDGQRGGV